MYISGNLIFWALVVIFIVGPLIDLIVPPFGERILLPLYCLFLRFIGWLISPSHSRQRNAKLPTNKL